MAATILYADEKMLMLNNSVSASNRISYTPYTSNFLAGGIFNHSNGELREEHIKKLTYDLVQNAPDDFQAKSLYRKIRFVVITNKIKKLISRAIFTKCRKYISR